MSIIKKVCLALIVLLGLVKGVTWWDGRNEGFALHKIQSTPLHDDRWDIVASEDDLARARAALAQPFHYLSHGFQCYAFLSQDGQYVLKFFRYQRLRLPQWVLSLPSFPFFDEWRKARLLALARRKDYLLRSCTTSWALARDETQILMVHLNMTKGVFPTVSITDRVGDSYSIPLDDYQFILQRRAFHVKPTLAALMSEGKVEAAQQHVDAIFALFVTCAKKGIQDTDGALIRKNNLGFLDGRAIYIDGGKLAPRKTPCSVKDFTKDLHRLRPLYTWLRQTYPQLADHFTRARAAAIHSIEQWHSKPEAQPG